MGVGVFVAHAEVCCPDQRCQEGNQRPPVLGATAMRTGRWNPPHGNVFFLILILDAWSSIPALPGVCTPGSVPCFDKLRDVSAVGSRS